ncbi:hypothetical protein EWM15_19565, partial [Clostridioides difficile]
KNKDVNIIFEDDIVEGIVENQERILSIKELELTYINKLLNKYVRETVILEEDVNAAPIVRLVNNILENAVRMEASDIHIEQSEN